MDKFDKRINEIYETLMVEAPLTTSAKTGMDIATKLAQDFDSKPMGLRSIHDKLTGGSGKKAKTLVKQYNDTAIDAAENEMNNMKNQAKRAKAQSARDAAEK